MKGKLWSACLFLCLVLALQALLTPWIPEGRLIGEYYENAGGNDVIFIGDCEVYENISPIALWEEYGIPSWIRGSPQQTVWQSYYLLEETFRYETPKVVVFNVLAMKYDTVESTGDPTRREAYNRITLDSMAWSGSKWKAIQASMTEEERKTLGMAGYLFPILRYHDRWSELTLEDVTTIFHSPTVSHCGYLMNTGVKPYEGFLPEPVPADFGFGEASWYYLNKMEALCREKGSELVLIKSPSLYPCWWEQWDRQITQYAREKGLLYINMKDVPVDWNTDTHDGGLHLNVYGAEKAALWLGEKLREAYSLPDRRGEEAAAALWNARCDRYYSCREEEIP